MQHILERLFMQHTRLLFGFMLALFFFAPVVASDKGSWLERIKAKITAKRQNSSLVPEQQLGNGQECFCSDPLFNKTSIMVPLCWHIYHQTCLSMWYTRHGINECPECRQVTPPESIRIVDPQNYSEFIPMLLQEICKRGSERARLNARLGDLATTHAAAVERVRRTNREELQRNEAEITKLNACLRTLTTTHAAAVECARADREELQRNEAEITKLNACLRTLTTTHAAAVEGMRADREEQALAQIDEEPVVREQERLPYIRQIDAQRPIIEQYNHHDGQACKLRVARVNLAITGLMGCILGVLDSSPSCRMNVVRGLTVPIACAAVVAAIPDDLSMQKRVKLAARRSFKLGTLYGAGYGLGYLARHAMIKE